MIKRMFCLLSAAVMLSGSGSISAYATAAEAFSADSAGFEYRLKDDGSCELIGYSGSAMEIDIPESIDGHKLTAVADECFKGNKKCTVITVPGCVKTLGDRWAYNCASLTKVKLKNGVKKIGSDSVDKCPELWKVILPPSVSSISGELTNYKDIKKYGSFYFYRGTYAEKYLKENKYHRITLPGRVSEQDVVYCKKSAAKLKWSAVSTASGYQVQLSPDSKFKKSVRTVTVKGRNTTSCVIKNIKADPSSKRCNFRIRTYRVISGKRYYGAFVGYISVRVK
ncbi:MAG: leucine-rich repeat protein [Ruminococcus sp.]|nr:leucine-rich repeat protein [Ruminococcus sp.]